MKVSLTKPQVCLLALLVTIMPWLTGGKDPLAVLISAFALLIGLIMLWRWPNRVRVAGRGLSLAAAGLIGWSALSLIWSVNRYQTVSWTILLVMAVAAFVIARHLTSFEALLAEGWTRGYIYIATSFSLFGLLLYLIGEYGRVTSSFYWANPFAAFILPAVLISWWRYGNTGQKLYLFAGAINLTAFILADSRGVSLILALLSFYAATRVRRKWSFWIKILFISGLAFLLSIGFALARQKFLNHPTTLAGSRYAEAALGESTSVGDRIYYIRSVVDIWAHYPLKGSGAGTYATIHPQYQFRVISAANNAHNFYLQTIAELGLVGGLSLAVVMVLLLAGVWRGVKADRTRLPWVVCLVGLLLHIGLDIDAGYPALLMLSAILAGITYLPIKATAKGRLPWLSTLALIAVLLPVVSLYESNVFANRGSITQDNGDFKAAAAYYNQAHHLPTYNPDVITAEGINDYTLGDPASLDKAKLLAKAAIKVDPRDSQHYFLLGRVLVKQKDFVPAEAAFHQALLLDPYNHPEYYNDLAQLLLVQNRTDESLNTVNQAIGLYPEAVVKNRSTDVTVTQGVSNLYITRALIEAGRQQLGQARSDLDQALKYYKDNPLAKQVIDQLGG